MYDFEIVKKIVLNMLSKPNVRFYILDVCIFR